jgi:diguanylate cyclase (GGDEF)-like protein
MSTASSRLSLRLKFNLVLLAVFLLSLAGAGQYYGYYLEKVTIEDVRENSLVMMETAMAIRGYTTEQIKPLLDPMNAERFQPQTVPAYAATETLRRLHDRFPGYEYKESVLNPTNHSHQADEWERALIERFRIARDTKEIAGIHGEGISQSVYVARPIVIKQPQCLSCHSTPEAAPASMRAIYGDQNGFGWQMNDIVGMQIVKLPVLYAMERSRQTFKSFIGSLAVIFSLMFLALNLTLSRLVIGPMAKVNAKLEELATTDFLTDLVNRRRFFEHLETAIADSRIRQLSFSVIIFDIDFFKRINDTFGHDSGDAVLKHTALRVRELLRSSDCAARFGGEEFIILLRETPIDAALAIAEAVRAKIADAPFDEVGPVSASFGVAAWNGHEDARALVNRADRALYTAKETGRNKVARAEDLPADRQRP